VGQAARTPVRSSASIRHHTAAMAAWRPLDSRLIAA
jgi:hypothetical protein